MTEPRAVHNARNHEDGCSSYSDGPKCNGKCRFINGEFTSQPADTEQDLGAMRELLSQFERAVRARGWSTRQASMEAVGSPDMIADMRRGRVPSVERVRAMCEVLGLEFYVGPHRRRTPIEARTLAQALSTANRAAQSCGLEMDDDERARVVAAIYDLIGDDQEPTDPAQVLRLIEAVAKNRGTTSATDESNQHDEGSDRSISTKPG